MASYSDQFVLSQWRYYGANISCCGNGKEQVLGLYQKFTGEARKRGLIRLDFLTNMFVET